MGLATVSIKTIPFSNQRIRFLGKAERDVLISNYVTHVRPIVTMLAFQGPRTQEALQSQWGAGDVMLNSEEGRVPEGPGGSETSSHSPTMNIAIESSSSDSVEDDAAVLKALPALSSESWRRCDSGTSFRTPLLLCIEERTLEKLMGEGRCVSEVCSVHSGDASPTMSFRDGGSPIGVGERMRTCLTPAVID